MSSPRILALAGFVLAVAAVFLGPPAAALPAAAVVAVASALVFFAAGRAAEGGARDPETAVRAAFGPALDALETLAVFTVDLQGHIGYVNRGAVRLFFKPAKELVGQPAAGLAWSETEDPEVAEGIREVFETGRALPARRVLLWTGSGPRVEAVLSMAPLVRYGKVVEVAVLRADTRGAGPPHERHLRLLDSAPVGLLGVDRSGRIDAVNRYLADLLGRRADTLEGLDLVRTEVLPEAVRALLGSHAARPPDGTPLPPGEAEILLVTPEGATRPFHVLVAPRAGGGADAVFVDGGSRRRLRVELEAARGSLAEARAAAVEAIALTPQDLR